MSMEKGLVGDTINDWWQTPLYDPKTQKISAVFGADGKFDYDATLEALKNMRFTYGIKVSNSSSVAALYSDDIEIKDKLPEGMEYVDTDIEHYSFQMVRKTNYEGNAPYHWDKSEYRGYGEVENGVVTFKLQKNVNGSWIDAGWLLKVDEKGNPSYLQIVYTTKLTDTKAAKIATMLQKQSANEDAENTVSVTLQNTATVTSKKEVLIDNKPGKVATDTADLVLKQITEKTAPGLTKAASDVKATRKSNDNINIPTWIITVSNAKTGDEDAPMTNIVLEDELSGGMQYAAGAKLDSDLSKNFNGYSTDGGETWNDLDDCVTVNGS